MRPARALRSPRTGAADGVRADHAVLRHACHDDGVDSRTSGLLLLLTTRLRSYAELCLPAHSRLRAGFLEDVADLEDPALGREQKLRVVDRMWKSWGRPLGWYDMAEKR